MIKRKLLTGRINSYLQTHSVQSAEAMIGKIGDKTDVSSLYGLAAQAFNTGKLSGVFRKNLSEIDCMQDIVIKLLEVIDSGKLRGDCYYFYLRRTAYNVLNDMLRAQFREAPLRERWEIVEKTHFLRARDYADETREIMDAQDDNNGD